MPDGSQDALSITTLPSLTEVPKEKWDRLTQRENQPYYPFSAWDFLDALEQSGSVRPETGWGPHHLLLHRGEDLLGVMPLYLKAHSRGEFVFDQSWADAYERAGGRYYPKLLGAIPFTPATGLRVHAETETYRAALFAGARQITKELGLSSLHVTFPTEEEAHLAEANGYLVRTGTQYRFADEGFGDWEGFLGALASRKRKALRKERQAVRDEGIEIDWITGKDITEAHLDLFWRFYQDTGSRKWGTPYLTREFFEIAQDRLRKDILLVMCAREGRWIAGAMNVIGREVLFGRYWGCTEHHPCLHFETCYYQATDFAIAAGLKRAEAGAQGDNKLARGYEPVTTRSLHHLTHPGLQAAVRRYLKGERQAVAQEGAALAQMTPFRKGE